MMLLRLHRLAFAVTRVGALIGGMLLLLAAIIIGIDIVLRVGFARSIGGADELSGYALAIATAWGLSFTLMQRTHIRIDSLYELFPAWTRAALDVLSLLAFLLFMGLTTWYATGVFLQSMTSHARSISALAIPLVIPQAAWLAGFVFLLLVVLLLLAEAFAALAKRDLRAVARLIGSKAVVEEVQEEIELAEQPLHGKGGAS
jgi:TRAP-type C4-dicarboxylate transport system permease small subunit